MTEHPTVSEFATTETRTRTRSYGYIVGRYFGLDTSGSAFYLAAWEGDDPEAMLDRLDRISSTAQEVIDVVDEAIEE